MTGSKYQSFIESSSITGSNAPYIEAYYEQFLDDPESVSDDWRAYFRLIQDQNRPREQAHSDVVARFEKLAQAPRLAAAPGGVSLEAVERQAAVLRLINYYRVRGHQAARLDPLGLAPPQKIPDLELSHHNLSDADLDTSFNTGTLAGVGDLKLREILRIVKAVYTDTIGAEYMHITETGEKRWIQNRLEVPVF
jgi:2-oxoglutarate dehydrogenase E1 component